MIWKFKFISFSVFLFQKCKESSDVGSKMTRVAKRSISGQQKKSLEPTNWSDMKPQQHTNPDKTDKSERDGAGYTEPFKKRKRGEISDKKAADKTKKNKLRFRCGKHGHRKQDSPAENDNATIKIKTAKHKERRSIWRREQRKAERDSKMVNIISGPDNRGNLGILFQISL